MPGKQVGTRSSAVTETARRFVSLNTLLRNSRSLTIIRNVLVPISISLNLCLYAVLFLRYSASKNGVTLKLNKSRSSLLKMAPFDRSYDFYWSAIVRIVVCCIIFKLSDVESS